MDMRKYDRQKIAAELDATAAGTAHYGNALRVAMDMPEVSAEDRGVLGAFATGATVYFPGRNWSAELSGIAIKIRGNAEQEQ